MFGWFSSKPVCPVDRSSKEWIEKRLIWLTNQFGPEHLLDVKVVQPTPEFFPDAYRANRKDALILLRRVCQYMKVDKERLELKFYRQQRPAWEGQYHGAAGRYAGDVIWLDETMLDDPLAVIGTLAHELGHVHLLGDGRISPKEKDHEPLTDLLTVFFGMGIFTANSVIREKHWHDGQVSGWNISRLGYLTMDMYGYAFALFAWYRSEEHPTWAKHLRGDVRAAYKKGVHYLRKTGDSSFRPIGCRSLQNE
jgi:hypothetical protein